MGSDTQAEGFSLKVMEMSDPLKKPHKQNKHTNKTKQQQTKQKPPKPQTTKTQTHNIL